MDFDQDARIQRQRIKATQVPDFAETLTPAAQLAAALAQARPAARPDLGPAHVDGPGDFRGASRSQLGKREALVPTVGYRPDALPALTSKAPTPGQGREGA